jgi:hypothetical protein
VTFAKLPTQPPAFDAGALAKHAGITDADVKNFQAWKQWVGGELAYDGTGLRDVVNADAQALNQLKADYDAFHSLSSGQITQLFERVTALEARPQVPFPGSSRPSGGA